MLSKLAWAKPSHSEVQLRDVRNVIASVPTLELKMGCAMFDTARALMRAGLGDHTGLDDSPALRVRLFERTYGNDFDAATVARIVAHLRGAPDTTPS